MRILVIAGAIAIAAGSTRTASGDGVGVVAATASPDQRAQVAAAMAAAVRAGGGRVTEDAVGDARAAEVAGAVPIATLARFRHVREEIDEGWRAYTRVQLDFAASRLAAARTDAEAVLALPGAALLYADASLRLGAVLAQLGRTPEARDAIALALALDPDRQVTELEFSPDVVAAVLAARAQPRPAHAVKISSDPAGATINVDGRDAGRAPLTVELAPGEHVLIARAPEYRPRAQAVAIDGRDSLAAGSAAEGRRGGNDATTAQLDFALEHDDAAARLAGGARLGLDGAGAQILVDATLELADLDEVAVVAETDRRGGPTLLVQRCASSPARCTAVVEIGYADASGLAAAARTAWAAVRSADLRYPPSVLDDPRVTDRPLAHRCELCRNPYVLGGVGLAAVVGTIVVIAVVTASKPAPVLTVNPTSFTH